MEQPLKKKRQREKFSFEKACQSGFSINEIKRSPNSLVSNFVLKQKYHSDKKGSQFKMESILVQQV